MTADALAGKRQIALALLAPGWEKIYYAHPPIDPIVCVGSILSHEKLAEGTYNFLLQGITRARIVSESDKGAYRCADLEVISDDPVMEIDMSNDRQRLTWMLGDGPLADAPMVKQFRQMLTSSLSTAEVVDLIAFSVLDDVRVKQSLLAQTDPRKRAHRVIAALEQLRPLLEAYSRKKGNRMN